jgi:hypothetical protein
MSETLQEDGRVDIVENQFERGSLPVRAVRSLDLVHDAHAAAAQRTNQTPGADALTHRPVALTRRVEPCPRRPAIEPLGVERRARMVSKMQQLQERSVLARVPLFDRGEQLRAIG